jgi:short subunit dehydrogenase-like uncharacterized protein
MTQSKMDVADWSRCLIYGAYGYSAEIMVRMCSERGYTPVLAGRSASKLEPLATSHKLSHRVVGLDSPAELDAALQDIDVVIHGAGPFSKTSQPMVEACLRTGTHYLDITGELAVFEACATRHEQAKKAGIMIMPGTGFDVVPTDCLAAHLKNRLPSATSLELAFRSVGGTMSHGTAMTTVENLDKPNMVRRHGKLSPVRSGKLNRIVDFGEGPVHTMAIPWGDVSTAWHTTKIPNITVYTAVPKVVRYAVLASSYVNRLFGVPRAQKFLRERVAARPSGPSDAERETGYTLLWGRVEDDTGSFAESTMRTTQGYTLTALASLGIAQRVLQGDVHTGYQTPASAYGPELILEFKGSQRADID